MGEIEVIKDMEFAFIFIHDNLETKQNTGKKYPPMNNDQLLVFHVSLMRKCPKFTQYT